MKRIAIIGFIFLVSLSSSFGQKFGEDSLLCVEKLSLYIEDYKLWKEGTGNDATMKNMINSWRWCFFNCSEASQNIYIHGAKIVKHMINEARNPEEKNKLIDTLMMVYDQRIKLFNQEGKIRGRQGVDLYKLRPEDYNQAYEYMKKSVELEGNKSNSAVLVYYFRLTIKRVQKGLDETSVIVDAYDQISDIIDYNIKNNPKRKANFENTKGNIEKSFEPFATCPDLVRIYSKKFSENPDDVELLKKITKILNKKECTDDPLFFEATIKLYDLEPSPKSAYLIGKMYLKKKEYEKASGYLLKGEELEDEYERADCFLLLAETYRFMNQYDNARSFARKALEIRPNDGNAYILIGDLYASSAKSCGNNDLTQKTAYWAAVDKYYKAKSVDPDIEVVANKRIATWSKYFPNSEIIFFHDLKEGDNYTVGCWINEITKVRAAK
jgi:tetratricopeptide (TPR) repeat protein